MFLVLFNDRIQSRKLFFFGGFWSGRDLSSVCVALRPRGSVAMVSSTGVLCPTLAGAYGTCGVYSSSKFSVDKYINFWRGYSSAKKKKNTEVL